MKSQYEKLLVATLAGMIIMSAAAFAISPALAADNQVNPKAYVTNGACWSQLSLSEWPASYLPKIWQ